MRGGGSGQYVRRKHQEDCPSCVARAERVGRISSGHRQSPRAEKEW